MPVNRSVSLTELDFSCTRSSSKKMVRDTQHLTEAHSDKRLVVLPHSAKASLHDSAIRYDPACRTVSEAQDNPLFEEHMVSKLMETTDMAALRRAVPHICTRKSSGRRGKRWNDMAFGAQVLCGCYYTIFYTIPPSVFSRCEKRVMSFAVHVERGKCPLIM
jgi:hypothetical protein